MLCKLNKLSDVIDYQLCCGCGVCAYLHPEFISIVDVPAFGRRPRYTNFSFDSSILKDAMQVCPGICLAHSKNVFNQKGLIASLLKNWGPVLEIWEAHAADPEIRFKGSSGGAITALALYCLEQENMTGVLHTVPDDEKPYCNKTVLSQNKIELLAGIGSRYSPASPCEKLYEVEKALQPCVVIGKPCDIAATQNVRKLKKRLDTNIGLTIACFCAGTPSTNGTLEMLRQMGVGDPNCISGLRYRGYGWPGMTTVQGENDDNCYYQALSYKESWGAILQKYRQWRCYICPDHTGEFADIAVGDPWYREPQKNELGQSLLLARTERGRQIISKAIASGYLMGNIKEAKILVASQPNLLKTRGRLWGQIAALKLFGVPHPSFKRFNLFSSWLFHLTFREKIASVAGTIKRIYRKKLKNRVSFE
ncbi:MAG: Coenzyme F420 hydrogenase/dehydrogenase, beta subunit C-terminal domain [Deltaproteobacteria bacterium]|nr:Coenzyme F420 hydrogenase/dehydrogenase, beta subunit C-terminal domain [Deltaproteobacteria bacterium]